MALSRCEDCSTLFSVGAETCPQCGGEKFHEEGAEPVKKTTRRKTTTKKS